MTRTVFLGTPGYVPNANDFDNENLMKAVGANTGNIIFQHASDLIIGGDHRHVGHSTRNYGDPSVFKGMDYFVFPAANHLRANIDLTLLTGFLKVQKAPLIILGLGAQAEKDANPRDIAKDLKTNPSIVEFVELLKNKAALISVRGTFSEQVCHELGLNYVLRLGCPSLFINPDPQLGQKISQQLAGLNNDEAFAVAANAPNEIEGWKAPLEQKLYRWSCETGGLYFQQSCEHWIFNGADGRLAELSSNQIGYLKSKIAPDDTLDDFRIKFKNVFRMFFSFETWRDALKTQSIVMGTRIHGNMAALAADRPGVLISHDVRVKELADEMHVPQVLYEAVESVQTVKEIVRHISFNAEQFDTNRKQKAKTLVDVFSKIGVPASDHLIKLAS